MYTLVQWCLKLHDMIYNLVHLWLFKTFSAEHFYLLITILCNNLDVFPHATSMPMLLPIISLAPKGNVILLIFSYSAIAYFPLPTFDESEFLKAHLARACKFDFLVSSEDRRFVIPSHCPPYLIAPESSHAPANRMSLLQKQT